MTTQKAKIKQLRCMFMSTPRILCTGNPNDAHTIASGIQQIFPNANFASRKTGFDLSFEKENSEQHFRDQLKNYNILINASYIGYGVQQKILKIASETWRHGHVINIGSTAEYNVENYTNVKYAQDKLSLQKLSLQLFNYRFRTTHIILGGIKNHDPDRANWLDSKEIATAIKYVLDSTFDIPIIGIQQEFDPW